MIKLDKNGDSEGNFSVLAYKEADLLYLGGSNNFSCSFYLAPVGQFFQSEASAYPVSKYHFLVIENNYLHLW